MPDSPLELFRRLTNGVYVIGVQHGDRQNAFTAAWLTQVSFDPLLIALSVNPGHASFPLLTAAKGFAISILPADGIALAKHFGLQSGRTNDKLHGQDWSRSRGGYPVLDAAVAQLDCSVLQEHVAGDHVVVIARVDDGVMRHAAATPLRYAETGNLDGSAALYPVSF